MQGGRERLAEVRIGTYVGSEQPLSQAGAGASIISKTCVTAEATGVMQTCECNLVSMRCNLGLGRVAGRGPSSTKILLFYRNIPLVNDG